MKTSINPFIYGRAVTPNEFIGRKKELRRLGNRLAQELSTAIIGLPHVGKTSLLNYLMDESVRQAQFGNMFQLDFFRVLDAQMLRVVKTQAEFWEQALQPVAEELREDTTYEPAIRAAYKIAQENEFSSFVLEHLFTTLKRYGHRLILFLDEFDDLISHPVLNSAEFYGSLRSLASRSLGLVLVLGSRRDVEQLNALTQAINPHGSPYFNVFTQITLKALPEPDLLELMSRGGEFFNAEDHMFIRAASGGHAFLAQTAAAKLWEAHEEGLRGVERYEQAGRELYQEAHMLFSDTWRVWTNDTRRAITIVTLVQIPRLLNGHTFSIQEDVKFLTDFSSELETLEDLGLLARTEEKRWVVTQGAFLWWLADELKRNVREETDFKNWLQAQEMDGLFTVKQKVQLSQTTSALMEQLGRGAATLIETFAKGAAQAALKQTGWFTLP